ncbi:MAG TPA: hypothetical protein VK524_32055 [Polyangiaceae bacterium]|nr:hypothetical protein [Polyangiaceae bacterium]
MLRHEYAQCMPCHVEPSGGGALSRYGRGIGQSLLPTQYGKTGEETGQAELLWNSVPLPEPLLVSGDVRLLQMIRKIENVERDERFILMQADAEATVQLERFVTSASIGYAHEGALAAAITREPERNLVSRQHWLGFWLAPSALLVRAGRMNLPYGIRNIEHTLWARALTRTSVDDDQQHGLALALSSEHFRGELMGIAGNFQLRPDDFRERGYSGYLEWSPASRFAVGASSSITHRELDTRLLRKTWRHAHGIFARWATPWQPLVLLTEWNYALTSPQRSERQEGAVGYLQADTEVTQGIHLIATGEAHSVGIDRPPVSYSAWLSYAWFFAPQADFRLDGIYQSLGSDLGRSDAFLLLMQAHMYL